MSCESQAFITYFEHLANELMFEIFEFLDLYHIYESFLNLNIRFDDLVICFTLTNKIHTSSMSKSTFQRYYTQIIIPYQDQITSLCLSNRFIFDLPSSPFDMISNMIRLETLILENIESKYLENILDDLASLPCLFSLVLTPIDDAQDKTILYRKIFRLPVLKYCEVTFNGDYIYSPLQMAKNNELSPIVNFIINSRCSITEFNALLSYVPQLRRLSCYDLFEPTNNEIPIQSIVLNNLTHLSLKMKDIPPFDKLELLTKNLFYHVQVFRISAKYYSAYSGTNRWERFVLSFMPNLRIFDIELLPNYELNQLLYRFSMDQFISLFWFERQWCFKHQYERSEKFSGTIYSTQPNRRKHYRLHNWPLQDTSPARNKSNFYSVDHICIRGDLKTNNNFIYFPNITKLTLFEYSNPSLDSISTVLDRIISLTQLTTLIINYRNFCVGKLIELLYYSPNISTLILHSISFSKISYTVLQETQTFEIISKKNKITNMIIEENCTLENVTLFNNLCPRLQHLTIDISPYDHHQQQSIVKFLLSNDNGNTRHLFSLCFTNANGFLWEQITSLNLLNDFSVQLVATKLYLWW